MSISDYKIILDVPSQTPALGFDQCAKALKDIVEGSQPRFAVGIFGSWGSGKTTLMEAIERQLDQSKSIAVRFCAWRYEKEPHLIVPLLDVVREALVAWAERNEPFKEKALATASTVGKAIYSLLAGLSFEIGIPNAIKVSYKANESLGKAEKFDEDERAAKIPRSFYHACFKALQDSFKEFLSGGCRIVVFVDDLDRCLPQGALEVLEAMKLFFDLEGFVFVVGLDQAVVERCIDSKYSETSRDSAAETLKQQAQGYQIRGADYIKKIFQVPYALPPVAIKQLEAFLDAIYSEAKLPPEQEAEFRTQVAPHLRYLVTGSGLNPREIKRYVNAYTLVRKIKPNLQSNVVLSLQTVAFRRDWDVVQQAILSLGEVFTDAITRQLGGEDTAVSDVLPTQAGLPESFVSYVGPNAPGQALLNADNLDEYIYAGEAVRSSLSVVFIDAIRYVVKLWKPLREMEKAPLDSTAASKFSADVHSALGQIKQLSYGRFDRLINDWMTHVNSYPTDPAKTEAVKEWLAQESSFIRRMQTQLTDLYQSGSQTMAQTA